MKKCIVLMFIVFSNVTFSQIFYRTTYDVGSFDLSGNTIQTPTGDFVFCGFNSTTLPPLYGNIVRTDNSGTVLWARTYTAGISTVFYNIKNVSSGGFIVCGTGGSNSGGAILVRTDNNGNVLWSNRYLLPNINSSKTSNEFFNYVIETSDGGFLAVGGVDYFWDGVSASTVDTTSFFAVKTNSNGVIQWSRVWTVSTPQPDESYFNACAESADGYLLVGNIADGSQAMSSGDYPSDAIMIKVDKSTGGNLYVLKFGSGNTSSQTIRDVITISGGNFLLGGQDGSFPWIGRIQGTGTPTSFQFVRRIQPPSFPPSLILTTLLESVIEHSDGNYSFVGWAITSSIPTSYGSVIFKLNSSSGATIFSKQYTPSTGIGVLLAKGNVVSSDQGFYIVNTEQQITGFNYNAIRTNSLGDLNLTTAGCSTAALNLTTASFNANFITQITNTYNIATSSAFTPISSTVNPATTNHCLNCNISIVPTPTASPNPKCASQTTTIGISGPVAGYNYNLYTSPTGGTFLGTIPVTVSPVTTTTYYIEVQSQSAPSCLSTTPVSYTHLT
ncbi:MAG: hypothetical protein N3F09_10085, partial [Bacteroidia bacterium]|nr:hypothetical protein [Bacteroidia bacterium]